MPWNREVFSGYVAMPHVVSCTVFDEMTLLTCLQFFNEFRYFHRHIPFGNYIITRINTYVKVYNLLPSIDYTNHPWNILHWQGW